MFGVVKYPGDERVAVTAKQAEQAVMAASDCGAAMVQVMESVINPTLLQEGVIVKELQMGVGVAVGEFVATNIGFGTAHELTAYGHCVNTACKRSSLGNNQVVLTNEACEMFPTSKTGKTIFRKHPDAKDAYFLKYPGDYSPLKC